MLHTLRFSLQNADYFIMLPFFFIYFHFIQFIYIYLYVHFTYRVCYNLNVKFKVCKSVHHRTIQINQQPDATVLQFIIPTFVYSSICFGRFTAHHQELNDCSGSLWFYLRIVVTVVLCSWSGRPVGPAHEHSTTITTIRK
jgi:hypothetical protein